MHSPPAYCQALCPKTSSVCLSVQPWCKLELILLDTLGWIQRGQGAVALHLPAMPSAVLLFGHVCGGERLCRLFLISPFE